MPRFSSVYGDESGFNGHAEEAESPIPTDVSNPNVVKVVTALIGDAHLFLPKSHPLFSREQRRHRRSISSMSACMSTAAIFCCTILISQRRPARNRPNAWSNCAPLRTATGSAW